MELTRWQLEEQMKVQLKPLARAVEQQVAWDAILAHDQALRERVAGLDKEVERLKQANEHWHGRVEQLQAQLAARVLKVEELEKREQKWRSALECCHYALTHPASDQKFAEHAAYDVLVKYPPTQGPETAGPIAGGEE